MYWRGKRSERRDREGRSDGCASGDCGGDGGGRRVSVQNPNRTQLGIACTAHVASDWTSTTGCRGETLDIDTMRKKISGWRKAPAAAGSCRPVPPGVVDRARCGRDRGCTATSTAWRGDYTM